MHNLPFPMLSKTFRSPQASVHPTQILLFFSLRQLRSQLSLVVIARMLGQQESLPFSEEQTQVSLPQQDQEDLWWATTPLPVTCLHLRYNQRDHPQT